MDVRDFRDGQKIIAKLPCAKGEAKDVEGVVVGRTLREVQVSFQRPDGSKIMMVLRPSELRPIPKDAQARLSTHDGEAAGSEEGSVRIETRGVLAGAYTGKYRSLDACRLLTHAVELDGAGREVRVLGGRCVRLDSLADAGALDDSERAALPTCPRCLKKDPRRER